MHRLVRFRCPCCDARSLRPEGAPDVALCQSGCRTCGGPCLGLPLGETVPDRSLLPPTLFVRAHASPTGSFAG